MKKWKLAVGTAGAVWIASSVSMISAIEHRWQDNKRKYQPQDSRSNNLMYVALAPVVFTVAIGSIAVEVCEDVIDDIDRDTPKRVMRHYVSALRHIWNPQKPATRLARAS